VGTSYFLHFTAITAHQSRVGKLAGGRFDLIEESDASTLRSTRLGRLRGEGMGNLARNGAFAITEARRGWRFSVGWCDGRFVRFGTSSRSRANTS
jgi:hypothetical protein